MSALKSLTRRLVGNRRRFARLARQYQAVLLNERNQVLFRGRTANVSRSGARLLGLPVGVGLSLGQWVRAEFLVAPRKQTQTAIKAAVGAHVWRIEEHEDRYIVALKFTRILDS
ncbi:MAG: PilZ domain-containing protein [Planctomycetes bacterium]|nr:PilZ domain-containing protein [Planctomycetota bacterium]